MIFLDDYIEILEYVPAELREQLTSMRELDLQVHNAMDDLDTEARQFFEKVPALTAEEKQQEYDRLISKYNDAMNAAGDKVKVADHLHDLVEKIRRMLDQGLLKLKEELRVSDKADIVEELERRSRELDNEYHQQYMMMHSHAAQQPHVACHQQNGTSKNPQSAKSASIKHSHSSKSGSSRQNLSNSSHSKTPHNNNSSTTNSQASAKVPRKRERKNQRASVASNSNNNTTSTSITSTNNSTTNTDQVNGSLPTGLTIFNGNSPMDIDSPDSASFSSPSLEYLSINPNKDAKGDNNNSAGNIIKDNQGSHHSAVRNNKNQSSISRAKQPISLITAMTAVNAVSPNDLFNAFLSHHPTMHVPSETTNANVPSPSNVIPPEIYCICGQYLQGANLIGCDNEDCGVEWFHWQCVGIFTPPEGKWYCDRCRVKKELDARTK